MGKRSTSRILSGRTNTGSGTFRWSTRMSGRVVLIGLGVGHGFQIWTRTQKGRERTERQAMMSGWARRTPLALAEMVWSEWTCCVDRLLQVFSPLLGLPTPLPGGTATRCPSSPETRSRRNRDSDRCGMEWPYCLRPLLVGCGRSKATRGHLICVFEPRKAGRMGGSMVRGRGNDQGETGGSCRKSKGPPLIFLGQI